MISNERLKELEELEKKATRGEWIAQVPALIGEFPRARIKPLKIEGRLYSSPMIKTVDAEFIAAIRNSAPTLFETIRKQQEAIRVLREALAWVKTECWNRCYDGSGRVEELSVNAFSEKIDEEISKADTILKGDA